MATLKAEPAENRYCVKMEWNGTLTGQRLPLIGARKPQTCDLYLDIFFEIEQEVEIESSELSARIQFGITGGELKLEFEECGILSQQNFNHLKSIDPVINIETQEDRGNQIRLSSDVSTSSVKLSGSLARGKQSTRTTENVHQIWLKQFSETHAVWCFQSRQLNFPLEGTLKAEDRKFVDSLQVTRTPCSRIVATFETSAENIHLTDGQAVLSIIKVLGWDLLSTQSKNIQNKSALVERLFIRRYLATKLKPYLSRQELNYV